jgi:hypothetical protein
MAMNVNPALLGLFPKVTVMNVKPVQLEKSLTLTTPGVTLALQEKFPTQ